MRAKAIGQGWHGESLRHSRARLNGKASSSRRALISQSSKIGQIKYKKLPKNSKNMTFKALKKRGVYLPYQGDADRDGVKNIKDCRPLNPKAQDNGQETPEIHKNWIERWQEAREEKEKHKLIEEAKELKKTRDERIKIEGRTRIHRLLKQEKEKLSKAKTSESQLKNEQRQETIKKLKEFFNYKPVTKKGKKSRKTKKGDRIFPTLKEIYG